uniref:Uncharacterized protein n=1 Tax=Rhizophora mucronata TaxID=61149 RepID=A0A2P2K449_RHIMU
MFRSTSYRSTRKATCMHLPLEPSPQGFCLSSPCLNQAFALVLSPSHLSASKKQDVKFNIRASQRQPSRLSASME